MMDTRSPKITRREFARFLVDSAVVSLAVPLGALTGCASRVLGLPSQLKPLVPSRDDAFVVAPGYTAREFIRWGDRLNAKERFGYNNDFVAFVKINETEAWMWVNHEYVVPGFVSGDWELRRTKAQVDEEMKNVGGSLLRVRRENGRWTWRDPKERHRRLDAFTKIPFAGGVKIQDSAHAVGTLANCAGGVTPWGTFLSCEENTDQFFGDRKRGKRTYLFPKNDMGWSRHYDHPPEHYGWVVEITPEPFAAKKLVSLGRFAHESATVARARDGRCVVYSGDDDNDRCLYKFVSQDKDSLERGTLYVANTERGEWIALNKENPALAHFKDDLEILTYAREAAIAAGGTPLDRPEDVEIHPHTGAVFVSLTNNKPKGRPYGSILKLEAEGGDHASLRFSSQNFLMGGEASGIACPDNLCFDEHGNLWVTTDISGKDIGTPDYAVFGNNGLFVVPTTGSKAGKSVRIAQAPVDAELTGPCFAPDGKSLFVAVQHPGETSTNVQSATSHWPDGGQSLARPAIMEIMWTSL
ncbi:MAG TPA: alkaline phosphatase PhoX [Bdellovibrionota bacterium]|jgi:secreted PhoX family phosphatase|nr:alkaline phosphatase PhoX [Bdellovibrionota bacterium]